MCSIGVGIALDCSHVNPVTALYWTAVLNGLLAPFLLLGILVAASDRVLMHDEPSPRRSQLLVGATALVMFVAAVEMFVF